MKFRCELLRIGEDKPCNKELTRCKQGYGFPNVISRERAKTFLQLRLQIKTKTIARCPALVVPACASLAQDFNKIFYCDEMADVIFVFDDDSRIRAYGLILNIRAPFLYRLCQDAADEEVPLPRVDSQAFKTMLFYLYTDEMPSSPRANWKAVLSAADQSQVYGLRVAAEVQLIDGIEPANTIDLALYAEAHNCAFLLEESVNMIVQSACWLQRHQKEEWKNMTKCEAVVEQVLWFLAGNERQERSMRDVYQEYAKKRCLHLFHGTKKMLLERSIATRATNDET